MLVKMFPIMSPNEEIADLSDSHTGVNTSVSQAQTFLRTSMNDAQICRPVSVFVKKRVKAATTATTAVMIAPIGFATIAAPNIRKPPAATFNVAVKPLRIPPRPPTRLARPAMPGADFAAMPANPLSAEGRLPPALSMALAPLKAEPRPLTSFETLLIGPTTVLSVFMPTKAKMSFSTIDWFSLIQVARSWRMGTRMSAIIGARAAKAPVMETTAAFIPASPKEAVIWPSAGMTSIAAWPMVWSDAPRRPMTPSASPPEMAVRNFWASSRAVNSQSMSLSSSAMPSGPQVLGSKSPVWKIWTAPFTDEVRVSIFSVKLPMIAGAAVNAGLRIASPSRPRAAPALSMAPEKVSPALRAAPPMPASMAFWKSSKPISPAEARS